MSSHKFEEKLSALGIVLDDRQKEQFDLFYAVSYTHLTLPTTSRV